MGSKMKGMNDAPIYLGKYQFSLSKYTETAYCESHSKFLLFKKLDLKTKLWKPVEMSY